MHYQTMNGLSLWQSTFTKHRMKKNMGYQIEKTIMVDPRGKRLIYIAACGRSGTTLLGFVLGNIPGAIDLGEINEYVRFDGRPNGFDPGTANYEFWAHVTNQLRRTHGEIDFDDLRKLHRSTDHHFYMLLHLVFGGRFRKQDVDTQRRFIAALYEGIFDVAEQRIVVDSSKYPSRLWHLSNLMPRENLYVIHLRRKAQDTIRAMRSGEQGKPKSFVEAAAYYHGIEAMLNTLRKRFDSAHWHDMDYDQFVSDPAVSLTDLGDKFQINVNPVIDKILEGQPLKTGFIFNGNRMRLNENVIFKTKGVWRSS